MEIIDIGLPTGPLFIYVAGTIGAGKSHFIENHFDIDDINILDVDAIRSLFLDRGYTNSEAISSALETIKTHLLICFDTNSSCAISGALSNFKGGKNKFKQAKRSGFTTCLIYLDTPTELAIKRNRTRFEETGFGVPRDKEEKIGRLNLELLEKINKLKSKKYVDFFLHVNNE